MQHGTHKFLSLSGLIAGFTAATDVIAGPGGGGTITYGPPNHSIPVLSDIMLVVLGLMLAVIAFRVLRTYPGGTPLASLVALTIAGATMMPDKIIEQAQATISFLELTSPAGGTTVHISPGFDIPIKNTSGATQQVKSVNPNDGCTAIPTTEVNNPQCTQGLIRQNNEFCYVHFHCGTET